MRLSFKINALTIVLFITLLLGCVVNNKTLEHIALSNDEQIIYDNRIYKYTKVLNAFVTNDDNIVIYETAYITKDEILVFDEFYYVKVSAIYNDFYIDKGLYQNCYINEQNKKAIVEAMALGISNISVNNLNKKLKRD
ncbi:MAG: hypothetical protein MRZ17_02485 [Acholeplasmataceae bacterium]|nr:hypothetical protein [Acholeplasmataceae bacterium]